MPFLSFGRLNFSGDECCCSGGVVTTREVHAEGFVVTFVACLLRLHDRK